MTPPPNTQTPEIAEALRQIAEDGYSILPGVIEADLLEALEDTTQGLLRDLAVPTGSNDFLGFQTQRLFNLLSRDRLFQQLPVHPAWLPIVEAILDRECLLSSLTAIHMRPGETDQPLHADDGSVPLPKPHAATACIAMLALSDFTEENGGTRVIPGSHLFDRSPKREDAPESVAIEMSAGSVLVYHGSLWHGGGANESDSARTAIVCNYCSGFLRQEECQLLALPRELVCDFSPRLRQLVGYGTYRGLLGHVDTQDPASLIDPSIQTDMVWRRIGR